MRKAEEGARRVADVRVAAEAEAGVRQVRRSQETL